jgi:hypothetical protein
MQERTGKLSLIWAAVRVRETSVSDALNWIHAETHGKEVYVNWIRCIRWQEEGEEISI